MLIVEKGTFNVLIAQLIEFQTQIRAKFQDRFMGTLKPMITKLRGKSHPIINKNAFPKKWISKVITSVVSHLSSMFCSVSGTWNSWKLLYEINYTQQSVETLFRHKNYLKLSQVAFFFQCKKSVEKWPWNHLPLLSK